MDNVPVLQPSARSARNIAPLPVMGSRFSSFDFLVLVIFRSSSGRVLVSRQIASPLRFFGIRLSRGLGVALASPFAAPRAKATWNGYCAGAEKFPLISI